MLHSLTLIKRLANCLESHSVCGMCLCHICCHMRTSSFIDKSRLYPHSLWTLNRNNNCTAWDSPPSAQFHCWNASLPLKRLGMFHLLLTLKAYAVSSNVSVSVRSPPLASKASCCAWTIRFWTTHSVICGDGRLNRSSDITCDGCKNGVRDQLMGLCLLGLPESVFISTTGVYWR